MQYTVCRMRCAVPVDHVGGARARWSAVGNELTMKKASKLPFLAVPMPWTVSVAAAVAAASAGAILCRPIEAISTLTKGHAMSFVPLVLL